ESCYGLTKLRIARRKIKIGDPTPWPDTWNDGVVFNGISLSRRSSVRISIRCRSLGRRDFYGVGRDCARKWIDLGDIPSGVRENRAINLSPRRNAWKR